MLLPQARLSTSELWSALSQLPEGKPTQLLDSFDAADPGSQFGAEQSRIRSFMGKPSNRCELLVDGVRGQTS